MNRIKKILLACFIVGSIFCLSYFVTAGVNKNSSNKTDEDTDSVCTVAPSVTSKKIEASSVVTTSASEKTTESLAEKSTQASTVSVKNTTENTAVTEDNTKQTVNESTLNISTEKSDYSCFDDCAFLGNSRIEGLRNFGLCKNVFSKVKLNVQTVFTEKDSTGNVILSNLNSEKKYSKIYIMFGDNEIGYTDSWIIDNYKKLINKVREYQPESEIYVISLLPISESRSNQNLYGYNISRIKSINNLIKNMCDSENVNYADVFSAMKDSKGYLPASASKDGVHFGKPYYCFMLNYLKYI